MDSKKLNELTNIFTKKTMEFLREQVFNSVVDEKLHGEMIVVVAADVAGKFTAMFESMPATMISTFSGVFQKSYRETLARINELELETMKKVDKELAGTPGDSTDKIN